MGSQQESGQVATLAVPGVWIGPAGSLEHAPALGISRVLSALVGPRDDDGVKGIASTHWVELEDVPTANLLGQLPPAIAFMRDAAAAGEPVLVRCAQGSSRSVAVVVAYVMAERGLDAEPALALVQEAVPHAQPNPGFMDQLRMWKTMGFKLDRGDAAYREFCALQSALAFEECGWVDSDALATLSLDDKDANAQAPTLYRCRKCRALLASSRNSIPVAAGPGQRAFSWRKRDRVAPAAPSTPPPDAEPAVFVEPLAWMGPTLDSGENQGKLYCPKCSARVGTYNWAGTQSSSGRWVVPAFQLHSQKLDVEPPPGSSVAAGGAGPIAANIVAPRGLPLRVSPPVQPARRFTHLIFDCDGVMVDSEPASCEALRLALVELSGVDHPCTYPDSYFPVFGMDLRTCLEYYHEAWPEIKATGLSIDDMYAGFADRKEAAYYRLTAGGIPAFAGVRQLITDALAAGVGVAIASSGSPAKIKHNLTSSGLAGLVPDELTVSAAYVRRGKPEPDVYLEALRRLGCEDASRAVVIEDAVNGCRAARSAKCFVAGVANTLPSSMLRLAADLVVEHVDELRPLFGLPNRTAGDAATEG